LRGFFVGFRSMSGQGRASIRIVGVTVGRKFAVPPKGEGRADSRFERKKKLLAGAPAWTTPEGTPIRANGKIASRLHHRAYVTKDMEANGAKFYEDVISGLPTDRKLGGESGRKPGFGAGSGDLLPTASSALGDGRLRSPSSQFESRGDQEQFGPANGRSRRSITFASSKRSMPKTQTGPRGGDGQCWGLHGAWKVSVARATAIAGRSTRRSEKHGMIVEFTAPGRAGRADEDQRPRGRRDTKAPCPN